MRERCRSRDDHHQRRRRWRRGGGGGGRRRPDQPRPDPLMLKRATSGTAPATRSRSSCAATCRACPASWCARTSAGSYQIARLLGGGAEETAASRSRSAATTRRRAHRCRTCGPSMEGTPGIADVRRPRRGPSEISVPWIARRPPRSGMSVSSVATTIQTNVAGTTAAQFRERGNDALIVVRLAESDREQVADVGEVLLSTPSGRGRARQERHGHQPRLGPGTDRPQEHGARDARQRRDGDPAQRGGDGGAARIGRCACRPASPSASARKSRNWPSRSGNSSRCCCWPCCSSTR